MTDVTGKAGLVSPAQPSLWERWRRWRNRRVSDPAFQSWASGSILTRNIARRDGLALFDLVAGFVHSQVLYALVELDMLATLRDAPQEADALALRHGLPVARLQALLNAGVALNLLERTEQGYQTARLGAAALGVPGLVDMIRHHDVLYRDLADPVALLRGDRDTELASFWPYVFGEGSAKDPAIAQRYSKLMAESQGLVAEETLRTVSFAGARHLMDVGGGTGAFLTAVGQAVPGLRLTLFDLPSVVSAAEARFNEAGLSGRVDIRSGSFRSDPLPEGPDMISLVRVLYDHADDTVRGLLAAVYKALPPGGRIVISEPMRGSSGPERPGDTYFAFYCMAMQTGRARSPQEIGELLGQAGFESIHHIPTHRPFVTSVITAER